MDTRFRCYRGFVSGFRGFRNPRQTGKQRDARGQMTREAPFRRRGCRYAPRTSRDARRAFFNASNVFFSEKYGEPRREPDYRPFARTVSLSIPIDTIEVSSAVPRRIDDIGIARRRVVVSCHVAVPLENVRGTPSRRTRWLARASAPLCPSRRGLEARRAGAATRTPRWPLSRDPIWGSARAAARWWRLSRPLTVACLGARPPPRPGPRTPRRRPPWRRTRRGPGPRPPRAPRPRRRSRRAPWRRTPRRRRAVRPSAWTNGPGRTRGPRKQTRRPRPRQPRPRTRRSRETRRRSTARQRRAPCGSRATCTVRRGAHDATQKG